MRKHAYITIPRDYDVYVHLAWEEIFLIELRSPLGKKDKILFILSCHSPGCDGKDLEALKNVAGAPAVALRSQLISSHTVIIHTVPWPRFG